MDRPIEARNPECSHCGAQEHYWTEISGGGGVGANILPLGFVAWAEGSRYRLRVCGTCGLTQWFVAEAFLDRVKARFRRESA